jgi:hypothetical protein
MSRRIVVLEPQLTSFQEANAPCEGHSGIRALIAVTRMSCL